MYTVLLDSRIFTGPEILGGSVTGDLGELTRHWTSPPQAGWGVSMNGYTTDIGHSISTAHVPLDSSTSRQRGSLTHLLPPTDGSSSLTSTDTLRSCDVFSCLFSLYVPIELVAMKIVFEPYRRYVWFPFLQKIRISYFSTSCDRHPSSPSRLQRHRQFFTGGKSSSSQGDETKGSFTSCFDPH